MFDPREASRANHSKFATGWTCQTPVNQPFSLNLLETPEKGFLGAGELSIDPKEASNLVLGPKEPSRASDIKSARMKTSNA